MNQNEIPDKAKPLLGQIVGKWKIERYINEGKSAMVFNSFKGDLKAAIKVYNSEIIERFGKETQIKRLDRQLELVGKEHENLIKVLDGGYCEKTDNFFLVMEYIDAPNLAEVLNKVPRKNIGLLISQVASAANFLEELGHVHRDIKPENIMVLEDFSKVILLDFGVIRPMGKGNDTDSTDKTPFLGTLRYSSPEYLLRNEEDTIEGWRGLTFYQIGSVLHDMIMQYPIFIDQSEPYARLVQAVCNETPYIYAENVSSELIHLAKECLIKNSKLRVRIIDWDDFKFPKDDKKKVELAKSRILSRKEISIHDLTKPSFSNEKAKREVEQLLYDINEFFKYTIRSICIDSKSFPPLEINDGISYESSSLNLLISFPSIKVHALTIPFTIVLTINILDLTSKVMQFQCAGVLSKDMQCNNQPQIMTDYYEGVFDENIMTKKLDEVLHLMFDQAQHSCSKFEKIKEESGKDDMELWFTLQSKEDQKN